MSYLDNEFFLLAVTFGVFFFSKLLQKKTGILLLNPILLTIAILIIFLKMAHINYETYNKGGYLIEFWLKPAVVALGVPLYLQLEVPFASRVELAVGCSTQSRPGDGQNGANSLWLAVHIAMHSISMSHPGRHTGAWTMSRGVEGNLPSNMAFTVE